MRKRAIICVTTLVTSLAGVALIAAPAHAVDTPVTVQIDGGALAISAPVGQVAATPITAGVSAQSVAFALGDVTVTDNVGGIAGWAVSVTVADFASANSTLPVAGGTYDTGVIAQTGIVTVTPTASTTLAEATTVATGSAASGVNTAIWDPTVTVAVPAGALAGTYASVVTHSVL